MSITVHHPIDSYKLTELSDASYTDLTLWYSDAPEGPYTDTGVSANQTIAAAIAAESYEFTWDCPSQTPAHWFCVRPYDGANYLDINECVKFHGGGGTLLPAIRKRLGELTDDMIPVTTTATGSTTTAKCSTFEVSRFADSYFANWAIHIPSTGYTGIVTASTKVAGVVTFTFEPATSSVASGVAIELYRRWAPRQYRQAINWAIETNYPILSRPVLHTGLRTAEDAYSYQVPHDIRTVGVVELESSNTAHGQPWTQEPHTVVQDGLVQFIEFKGQLPYTATAPRRLRIRGTGSLSQLYSETDYTEAIAPQLDLILFLAAHHLYTLPPNSAASSDKDFYVEQAKYYLSLHSNFKSSFGAGRTPVRIWGHDAVWRR